MEENTLEVTNLETSFQSDYGSTRALENISFHIKQSEVLALVGESGSGKTVTSLSIMGLLPSNGKINNGKIILLSKNNEEINILQMTDDELNKVRGKDVSMIFQEPMTCLNPTMTIGNQITEVILNHKIISKNEANKSMIDLLKLVEIPDPNQKANEYPHQLSGGMRQRVMISIALACEPKLIIADEPTTALDVTVQAQIMELFKDIQKEFKTSFILITHNMGIVADACLKTLVLYGGKIMEYGLTTDVFLNPSHPYTIGLLETMPRIDKEYEILKTIPGNPPNMMKLPKGCPFSNRCSYKINECIELQPPIKTINNQDHQRACHVPLTELNL